jgi:hypothetical protein
VAASLWTAREAMSHLLFPVWAPLSAPVEAVEERLPNDVTFWLRYYKWKLRLRIQVLRTASSCDPELWLEADLRRGGVVGRLTHRWRHMRSVCLVEPVTEAVLEKALGQVRGQLLRLPDVDRHRKWLYAQR